jgi:flagellar protein FliO/FliZ
MFDSLLGVELPLAAKFVLAFVVVLALIAGTFWLIRRFGANRAGGGQARGRQPRLAVIDATAVDSRRRLVLIRRDNVEHLVMIGGPSDVVIEQNIVRAVPVSPPRDTPSREAPPKPAAETVTRGADLVRPEAVPSRPPPPESTWSPPPLPDTIRPRSEAPPRASELSRPLPESLASMRSSPVPPMPEPRPPRPPADHAPVEVRQSPPTADVNLADMAQRLEAALRRPGQAAAEARADRPPPPPREQPMRPPPRPAPSDLPPQFTRANPRPAPSTEPPPPRSAMITEPPPRAIPPMNMEPAPRPPVPAMNMDALSRPPAPAPAPAESLTIETHTIETHTIETHTPEPPHAEPHAEAPEHPVPEPDPVKPMSKSVFDSLEEEMASLLGRPEKP